MPYECRGCGKQDSGKGDVYPRMIFNWKSETICPTCKIRLEEWLTDKWREWFRLQARNQGKMVAE